MTGTLAPEIWFPYLKIEIIKLPKVIFSIFGIEIYWYGALVVLGIVAGLFTALLEAKRTGQKSDMYYDLLFLGMILSLIGLRLYYVIFSWDDYKNNLLSIFDIRQGGLAIYGGIIGMLSAGVIMAKIKKVKFVTFADTCAPSIAIGQAIGRWGNFFNREAFGGYTENIFAMRILKDQAQGVNAEIFQQTVFERGASYIQVHPTFFYESIWNFALFTALWFYRPHKKFNGEVMLMYLAGYGFGRFFIEHLRSDQLMLFGTSIPVSQLVSAIVFLGAVGIIIYTRKKIHLI